MLADTFFSLVRRWHESAEASALIEYNDFAVAVLSASNVAPSHVRLPTPSTTDNRPAHRTLLEVQTSCCCRRVALTESERYALAQLSATLPCDTLPHGDGINTSWTQLLTRAHDASCIYRLAATRHAFLSMGSADLCRSPAVRASCAAVRLFTSSPTPLWLLPSASSTRLLRSQAMPLQHILAGESRRRTRHAHSDDPPHHTRAWWCFAGDNLGASARARVFGHRRAPTPEPQEQLPFHEKDNAAATRRTIGGTVALAPRTEEACGRHRSDACDVAILVRLYGYEAVAVTHPSSSTRCPSSTVLSAAMDCDASRRDHMVVQQSPTHPPQPAAAHASLSHPTRAPWSMLGFRLRCRYCAAEPPHVCHVTPSPGSSSRRPESHHLSRPTTDCHITLSRCPAARTREEATLSSGHYPRCPWRRLFLQPVLGETASSSSSWTTRTRRTWIDVRYARVKDAAERGDAVNSLSHADPSHRDTHAASSTPRTRAAGDRLHLHFALAEAVTLMRVWQRCIAPAEAPPDPFFLCRDTCARIAPVPQRLSMACAGATMPRRGGLTREVHAWLTHLLPRHSSARRTKRAAWAVPCHGRRTPALPALRRLLLQSRALVAPAEAASVAGAATCASCSRLWRAAPHPCATPPRPPLCAVSPGCLSHVVRAMAHTASRREPWRKDDGVGDTGWVGRDGASAVCGTRATTRCETNTGACRNHHTAGEENGLGATDALCDDDPSAMPAPSRAPHPFVILTTPLPPNVGDFVLYHMAPAMTGPNAGAGQAGVTWTGGFG